MRMPAVAGGITTVWCAPILGIGLLQYCQRGRCAIDKKLAQMDVEPDFDGRFRVNDFFCYDDTWRLALTTLVKHSDVVMLDLRGFTPANAGCIFELNELVNSTPLARIVLIIDATTDVRFLKEALQAAWSQLRQGSPN
ncbi:MAG: hypothetical protein OEQ39_23405, partial [Gammaproteobacteria bacterium]|nr:hypothetical protein [Gammaproteobacteria bacterium]